MAAEEKKKYVANLQQWELSMIQQGKENLIRKKTLHELQRTKAKAEGTKRTRAKTVAKKSGVKSKKAVKSSKSEKSKEGKDGAVKKKVQFDDSEKEK